MYMLFRASLQSSLQILNSVGTRNSRMLLASHAFPSFTPVIISVVY